MSSLASLAIYVTTITIQPERPDVHPRVCRSPLNVQSTMVLEWASGAAVGASPDGSPPSLWRRYGAGCHGD